jgi:dTDP-4-dehydrorhamnose 3,5-epimerase
VLKFKEVKVFEPSVHTDYRGDLWTVWNSMTSSVSFNHDKVSTSRKHVLRGIHGDYKSTKLVTCLHGELYFVVVDNRKDSDTYLQWDHMILDDRTRKMVLLPPGFGNAFFVLSDNSVFFYKWAYEGSYPDVQDQFTLKWNDERLSINWPIEEPILQPRDK